jgi:hypothetical protein
MRSIAKPGFTWPFIGGFVIGAIGLVTLQPADATRSLANNIASAVHVTR